MTWNVEINKDPQPFHFIDFFSGESHSARAWYPPQSYNMCSCMQDSKIDCSMTFMHGFGEEKTGLFCGCV